MSHRKVAPHLPWSPSQAETWLFEVTAERVVFLLWCQRWNRERSSCWRIHVIKVILNHIIEQLEWNRTFSLESDDHKNWWWFGWTWARGSFLEVKRLWALWASRSIEDEPIEFVQCSALHQGPSTLMQTPYHCPTHAMKNFIVPKELTASRAGIPALFSFFENIHAESLEMGDTSVSIQEMV